MITIDSEKQIVDVNGDTLTLASEMSMLNHELHKAGFGTMEFASITASLLFLTFNKEERKKYLEHLQVLIKNHK